MRYLGNFMLLNESRSLDYSVDEPTRIAILDALRSDQRSPLILTSRRRCFELSFGENAVEGAVREIERQLLAGSFEAADASYTPGELFYESGCVFYLTFDEQQRARVRAGVVYDSETSQPIKRFDDFCNEVREAIQAAIPSNDEERTPPQWHDRALPFPQGLARFISRQDEDLVRLNRFFEGGSERTRASLLVANDAVRTFLRRAQEARLEGYSPTLLQDEMRLTPMEGLVDAGLMQREVRITCRKTKHALFDLPSPDALTLITVSRAKCSLCATPVSDEVVEEVFNPTSLGLALLEDGNWLRNRVYQIIREIGVPDYEIAPGPESTHGESYLVANVCGEPFLFAIRDGELSPSFTRRVTSAVGETDARHIVAVVTGPVEEEARMRLYEYAWRRARDGKDVEVSIISEPDKLRHDLEKALERVSLRTLARDLFALDAVLGTSANRFVLATFKLWKRAAPSPNADETSFNGKQLEQPVESRSLVQVNR